MGLDAVVYKTQEALDSGKHSSEALVVPETGERSTLISHSPPPIFSVGRIPVCHCHHISARSAGDARPAESRV